MDVIFATVAMRERALVLFTHEDIYTLRCVNRAMRREIDKYYLINAVSMHECGKIQTDFPSISDTPLHVLFKIFWKSQGMFTNQSRSRREPLGYTYSPEEQAELDKYIFSITHDGPPSWDNPEYHDDGSAPTVYRRPPTPVWTPQSPPRAYLPVYDAYSPPTKRLKSPPPDDN